MYRKQASRLIAILLSSLCLLAGCDNNQPQLVEQRILQFGTVIDISLIHTDIVKAENALNTIEQDLQQYREYWHAWEDSDLFRFNRALLDTTNVPVPPSLNELIKLSREYYDRSQQLFNPAIGGLIAAYGFHDPEQIDHDLISRIQRNPPTMHDLKIVNGRATSSNPHLQLDFGGIAKGYAMSLVARYLKSSGIDHFLINAGGDLITSGTRFGKPWRIGIQNPFAPGALASSQLSDDQYLFTSGNYQRFYLSGDDIVHHIIDPRSGQPSTHISSATVLADNAVLADVAATTLMIDGWENHQSLAASLGISDYMIINQSMEIIVSKSFSEKIELLADTPFTVIHNW